jgi:hypothetical protein
MYLHEMPNLQRLHELKTGGTVLCHRKNRLFADKESLYLPDLPGDTHDGA